MIRRTCGVFLILAFPFCCAAALTDAPDVKGAERLFASWIRGQLASGVGYNLFSANGGRADTVKGVSPYAGQSVFIHRTDSGCDRNASIKRAQPSQL